MPQSLDEVHPTLKYGGNTYSRLTREQQNAVYEELLRRCHTLVVLQQERFILENEPLPLKFQQKAHLKIGDFVATPQEGERRKVVVLDCEWDQAVTRLSEPVAVCAIDFLTGETLVYSLITPSQMIFRSRSHLHGITAEDVEAAAMSRECFYGWKEAREKLFEFVGEETILVGHSVKKKLQMLRMFHRTIVDSQVLAKAAAGSGYGKKSENKWQLLNVCEELLGVTIRQNSTSSALENALASREIVLRCVQQPKDLDGYGRQTGIDSRKPNPTREDNKKAMDNGDFKSRSTTTHAHSGPITCEGNHLVTYSDGYEAGYRAAYQKGFESGFQVGYERSKRKADPQMNQDWAGNTDQNEYLFEDQHDNQEAGQYTGGEEIPFRETKGAGQDDNGGCDQAAGTGNLLAQLMENMRVKEMVQGVNKDRSQKETAANEGSESKAPGILPESQASKSRWSNYHGWKH
ncbi:hypothetical protein TARUN_378 [Trichoderma arundinaceum]|uniref:Exonuclease domain-containing protein n=1 Tax=Trichoderma arundinaceum TaxID=490622 RepID=A0A395P0B5_TRIAR|nr:hypothetical protein TARUN_378 [Trichoderma arundinaceum]